jgi:hypothetical protein
MKRLAFFSLFVLSSISALCQEDFEKTLVTIEKAQVKEANKLDSIINSTTAKIISLDNIISDVSSKSLDITGALAQRIMLLEKRDSANQALDLNVYQLNYQRGVINLAGMQQDLKPAILFSSSTDFFMKASSVGNPMRYAGYDAWFKTLKEEIEKNERGLIVLESASKLLGLSGATSPTMRFDLSGPLVSTIFTSAALIVDNLGTKKKDFQKASQEMLGVTLVLGQYNNDKSIIEKEWESILKDLDDLKSTYQILLRQNLEILGIDSVKFNKRYSLEDDADKRRLYLNELAELCKVSVEVEKNSNPSEWKSKYYYPMNEIQSIKIRYGSLIGRMQMNIERYEALFEKYDKSTIMADKLRDPKQSLNSLKKVFNETFNSERYIRSSVKMYRIL